MDKERKKNRKVIPIAIISSILLAVIITVLSMTIYKNKISEFALNDMVLEKNYNRHYAFITEEPESPFWNNVYEGAREKGEELDIYVEKFGSNLPVSSNVNELLKMSIMADVDGIILQASSQEETLELINLAEELGIPVTTVLDDSPISKRTSFVGVNNYQLGSEYGNQVLEVAGDEEKSIMVLLDSNSHDSSPDIILSGIKDTLKDTNISISVATIDRKIAFSSEEAVHNILLNEEDIPDILICLNSTDTICAYQTVVDYNKVGEITIIGYYNSEIISQAIAKEVIYSTIVIDTREMGATCVEVLSEFATRQRVSEYISVNMNLVTKKNVQIELN